MSASGASARALFRPPADFAPELDFTNAVHAVRADGVAIRWLGTAGVAIEYAGKTLLIDPYITRASLVDCVTRPLVSDLGALARVVPSADVIVVGHTHFDHALDVPAIALATGAQVFGSRSASALCRRQGVARDRVCDVESALRAGSFEIEVEPFKIRFFASAHSKLLLGRVPFAGDIDDCDAVALRTHGYRCGAVFCAEITVGGRRIVHLGSAELVEANLPRDLRGADLLLLTVAGWTKSARFPTRMFHALEPQRILLTHWDDFFSPIDRAPRALPAIGFGQLFDALARENPHVAAGWVPMLATQTL